MATLPQQDANAGAARATITTTLPNCFVYNADGAARGNGDNERKGSMGALLRFNGVTLASLGVYLGDVTNNIAEYHGALAALEHACRVAHDGRVCLRLDSMLIVRQLIG